VLVIDGAMVGEPLAAEWRFLHLPDHSLGLKFSVSVIASFRIGTPWCFTIAAKDSISFSSGSGHCPLILSDMRQLMKTGVAVEKLFSRDFTNEIRSQVIESSFVVGAEIHRNYWFGSFSTATPDFDSYATSNNTSRSFSKSLTPYSNLLD
jgi:hypothetical protein